MANGGKAKSKRPEKKPSAGKNGKVQAKRPDDVVSSGGRVGRQSGALALGGLGLVLALCFGPLRGPLVSFVEDRSDRAAARVPLRASRPLGRDDRTRG